MENNEEIPIIENFEVEPLFEDHVHHQRHAFTFNVQGDEFKGHFHKDEIQWLHPHPKQKMDEERVEAIESAVYDSMKEHGITSGIEDFEVTQAFENRPHERKQFNLQVQGEEFKGFVHDGEIQWFHPQPQQKLEDKHLEAIEAKIHEKIMDKEDE